MKIFWFFLYIVAAFYWFCCAFGFATYSSWLVTFAFAWMGVNLIVSALKEVVE